MNLSKVKLPENGKFGLFFAAFFSLVGVYLFTLGEIKNSIFVFGIAAFFLILALFLPRFLLPLNKMWMGLGLLIGAVVNPLVLGLIFFGFFTPISLLMKIFGRDELRLKLSSDQSHWKTRAADAFRSEVSKQQF